LLYLFEDYGLDTDRRELYRATSLILVEPKVFDLLVYVIRNRNHVVSKDDLIANIWNGRIVSESALTTCINAARTAIGDSGEAQRLIKTLSRKGIRFVGIVREEDGRPAAVTPTAAAPAHAKHYRPWLRPAIVGAILALAAGGFAFSKFFQEYSTPPIELASKARMELPLPDKPSIAVLPFANMSSEAGQQHFADGMTDSLITDLSKVSSLFVIARNSTFVYQGKPVKVSQVAEELGVRYVLEGSVQRVGDHVRVNAQLIDALRGGHIWADRFDGNVSDTFAAQDAFVAKIVEALQVTLTAGEKQTIASGKTKNISAKEAFDEGWSLYLKYSPEDIAAAITALKRATELDPQYGRAYAALALVYIRILDSHWFKEFGSDWFKEFGSAREVWAKAQESLELAKRYPTSLSYTVVSYLDTMEGRGRLEEARRNADRAIALDPNDPEAHIGMAWVLICLGEPTEALNFLATAMRLNPNYPAYYPGVRGLALFAKGDVKQAAEVLEEGVRRNPHAAALFPPLSSYLAQLGRREEARQMLQKYRPGIDQRGLDHFADAALAWGLPFWDEQPRLRERYVDGLRVAALPLDTTVASLVVELEGSDTFRRMFAAKRLGWFGPAAAQAVPALIEALKNEYVRREAVQSLGKIGPDAKAAIPALMAMQDEDPIIGFYAKNALKEIKGN